MVIQDCKRDQLHTLHPIPVQHTIQVSKTIDHLLVSYQLVKKALKLISMLKPMQARTPSLMYMMIVCKINNKDDNTILNDDQPDNHLPPIDNLDLQKLIHQYR